MGRDGHLSFDGGRDKGRSPDEIERILGDRPSWATASPRTLTNFISYSFAEVFFMFKFSSASQVFCCYNASSTVHVGMTVLIPLWKLDRHSFKLCLFTLSEFASSEQSSSEKFLALISAPPDHARSSLVPFGQWAKWPHRLSLANYSVG